MDRAALYLLVLGLAVALFGTRNLSVADVLSLFGF